MNRVALRARAVPAPIRAVLILLPLAVAAYWCFDYAGPYRWLAELQINASGGYEIVLTGLVTVLIALVPSIIIIQLLAGFFLKRDAPGDEAQRAAAMQSQEQLILANRGYIIAAIAFLGFAGTSGYFLLSGLTAGDPITLEVAKIEGGARPSSRQVVLLGQLQRSQELAIEETHNSTSVEKVYIPLVSPGRRLSDPAVVYLETYRNWFNLYGDELASGKYRGMLSENSLPGLLRADLEKHGRLPKGSHWVLDFRASADEDITMGLVFATVAGIVFVITGVIAFVRRRKTRS